MMILSFLTHDVLSKHDYHNPKSTVQFHWYTSTVHTLFSSQLFPIIDIKIVLAITNLCFAVFLLE